MHRCIDSDACHQHGEERTPPKEVWEEIWVSLMVHLRSKYHIICNTLVSLVRAR